MKTIISLLLLLACFGCASRYNITLANGAVITSHGKPHYDRNQGVWIFKDANGQVGKIPGGSVTQVAPRSMMSSSGDTPAFNSSDPK